MNIIIKKWFPHYEKSCQREVIKIEFLFFLQIQDNAGTRNFAKKRTFVNI